MLRPQGKVHLVGKFIALLWFLAIAGNGGAAVVHTSLLGRAAFQLGLELEEDGGRQSVGLEGQTDPEPNVFCSSHES